MGKSNKFGNNASISLKITCIILIINEVHRILGKNMQQWFQKEPILQLLNTMISFIFLEAMIMIMTFLNQAKQSIRMDKLRLKDISASNPICWAHFSTITSFNKILIIEFSMRFDEKFSEKNRYFQSTSDLSLFSPHKYLFNSHCFKYQLEWILVSWL